MKCSSMEINDEFGPIDFEIEPLNVASGHFFGNCLLTMNYLFIFSLSFLSTRAKKNLAAENLM